MKSAERYSPTLTRIFAHLPARRVKRPALKPIQLASLDVQGSRFGVSRTDAARAFVLDYELVCDASDVTFRSDTTYWVDGLSWASAKRLVVAACALSFASKGTHHRAAEATT